MWVGGAVYTLLGAGAFSELGTAVPRSGGLYVFAHRALGRSAGVLVGYTDWVNICVANAALAIVVGEYAGALVPGLAGRALPIAFGTIILLAAAQWHGVRWGGGIQEVTTLVKTAAFVVLIAACLFGGHTAPAALAAPPFPSGLALLGALVLSLQGVLFTYDSYYYVVYSSEELRDPGRTIPRSIYGAAALVVAVYLLVNVAFLRVVPVAQMAGDPFVGGSAARAVFGSAGDAVIRGIVIVSVIGTVNAFLIAGPRVLLAMGRDGLFAHEALTVNVGGTPTTALALSTVVSLAFLLTKTFERAIAISAVFTLINYLVTFTSLVVLRRRALAPDLPRPFRAWGYPWTLAVLIAGAVLFLGANLVSDTGNSLIALAIVVATPLGLSVLRRRGVS